MLTPVKEVMLRPMTREEFPAWQAESIERYAAEKVTSGSFKESTALSDAGAEFARLLPDGPRTPDHHLFVAEEHGRRVGVLWLHLASGGTRAFVYNVEVDPAMRGIGYGRAVMTAALSWAQEHGADSMSLHVFSHNRVARNLYRSLGFVTTDETMRMSLAR